MGHLSTRKCVTDEKKLRGLFCGCSIEQSGYLNVVETCQSAEGFIGNAFPRFRADDLLSVPSEFSREGFLADSALPSQFDKLSVIVVATIHARSMTANGFKFNPFNGTPENCYVRCAVVPSFVTSFITPMPRGMRVGR